VKLPPSRPPSLRRLLPIGLFLALSASGCSAPWAVALNREAAEAIRKGIESGKGVMDHRHFDRVLHQHAWEWGGSA